MPKAAASGAPSQPFGAEQRGQRDAGHRRRQREGQVDQASSRPRPGKRSRTSAQASSSPSGKSMAAASNAAPKDSRSAASTRGSVSDAPHPGDAELPWPDRQCRERHQHDDRKPDQRDAEGQPEAGMAQRGPDAGGPSAASSASWPGR